MITQDAAERRYINALIERQEAGGLNDSDFARRLGVTQAAWSLLRAGKRGVGVRFLKSAMRAFPDVAPDTLVFLAADMHARKARHAGEQGEKAAS